MNTDEFVQYYNKDKFWKYPELESEYIHWLAKTRQLHPPPYCIDDFFTLQQMVASDPEQKEYRKVKQERAREAERLFEERANRDNFIISVNELWNTKLYDLLSIWGVIAEHLPGLGEADLPALADIWGVEPPYKREDLSRTIAYLLTKGEKLPISKYLPPLTPTTSKHLKKKEQLLQFNERNDNIGLTFRDKRVKWNEEHLPDEQYRSKDAFEKAIRRAYKQ